MSELDPRLNAYRADLAAASLKGRVEAARFVEGRPAQVARGVADLRREPRASAPLDTQLLFGEAITVYDQAAGWAWVQNAADGYVGYVEAAALGAEVAPPSHAIRVLRTFLYPEPDLKAPPLDALSFLSPVQALGARNGFTEVRAGGCGGWVYGAHLAEDREVAPDFVATALTFLGVPYLWGGRSSLGLDCSALVQLALVRAGVRCPRDTYVQECEVGVSLPGDTVPRRGDLVFFPGHCAIALDETDVIHCNAGAMLTAIEPLADVLRRVERESGGRGVTSVRRIAS